MGRRGVYQYSTAGLHNLYVVSGSKEIADLFVAQINADYAKVQSLRDILGQHAAMTSGIQILLVQGSGTISGEFGFDPVDMNGLSGVANWFHTSTDADGDPIYAANSTLPYGVSLTLNLDNATTGGTPSAASIQFQKLVQVTVHELWHPFAGDHLWEKAANPVDRFPLSVNDITGDTSYARDFETFAQQGRIGFALDTVTVGNTAWVGQIVLAGTPAAQNKSVGTIVGAGTDDEIMVVDQATFSKVLGNIIFKQHVKNRAAAIEAQREETERRSRS